MVKGVGGGGGDAAGAGEKEDKATGNKRLGVTELGGVEG